MSAPSPTTAGGDKDQQQEEEAAPNRILVYLRIRPQFHDNRDGYKEGAQDYMAVDTTNNKNLSVVDTGKPYAFDKIWEGNHSGIQADVFQTVAKPVINNVFDGYWGSMMVYGQTGSGKSFTMCEMSQGGDKSQNGIIPRTMDSIFTRIEQEQEHTSYTVTFSFIQVYMDKLGDLFNPMSTSEIKIVNEKDGVTFPGLTEKVIKNSQEFDALYQQGNRHRVVRRTDSNPHSSRGHAALLIKIKSTPKDPAASSKEGKLFMIDLAGYERFSKTGAEGIARQEARCINGSLLSLGNCISSLSEKADYIPWRNAKLTRMLEDAIGGKAKCSIILTASPSNIHSHETNGTLSFGSRAMNIGLSAVQTTTMDFKKLSSQLSEMLKEANEKIGGLESEKASLLQQLASAGVESPVVTKSACDQDAVAAPPEKEAPRSSIRSRASSLALSSVSNSRSKRDPELQQALQDLDYQRTLVEESKAESRNLAIELAELRLRLEMTADIPPPPPYPGSEGSPSTAAGGKYTALDAKAEVQRKVESIRMMLEETYDLKLAEVEEPLKAERDEYRQRYEELRDSCDEQLSMQKDALSASYEEEIAQLKHSHLTALEKLKKNHATIKKSYVVRAERVEAENVELLSQVTKLTNELVRASSGQAASPEQRPGAPSLAETVILKKQAERKARELEGELQEVQLQKSQLETEKDALLKTIQELETTVAATNSASFANSTLPCIPPMMGEYIPFLLARHGGGVGRKYTMNSKVSDFWFSKLKAEMKDFVISRNKLNWSDACLIRSTEDVPVEIGGGTIALRGIVRCEGTNLFVAITSRHMSASSSSSSSGSSFDQAAFLQKSAMDLMSKLNGKIHHLNDAVFRGNFVASVEEMILQRKGEGHEAASGDSVRSDRSSRSNASSASSLIVEVPLKVQVKSLLQRFDVPTPAIEKQVRLLTDQSSVTTSSANSSSLVLVEEILSDLVSE